MNLFDVIRVVLDESVGNRGALENCRHELHRRSDAERQVDRLCDRIPTAEQPGAPSGDVATSRPRTA